MWDYWGRRNSIAAFGPSSTDHGEKNEKKRGFRLSLLWARKLSEGCIAMRVGTEGERPQRLDVPAMVRLHHVLFMRLFDWARLKFDYDCTMVIPCSVDYYFRNLLQKIV